MNSFNRTTASLMLFMAMMCVGCAGYEGAVREMRTSLLTGDKQRALELSNVALKVDESDEFPEDLKGDSALLLLERAMIKQGLTEYSSSAKDFQAADKHLELLDLQNDTMGNISKFIFSDDATVYKAPAYEKLMVNTFNMLNYMALGDFEGARVESRRLRVMQKYLAGEKSEQAALLSLGSYLAGFAFEASGQHEQALSFYADALRDHSYGTLAEPVRRLSSCAGGNNETIATFVQNHGGPYPECVMPPEDKGTVLVVSGVGLAPYKVAKRIPIGLAVTIAGAYIDPYDADMQRVMARGMLTWVNFPVLERSPVIYTRVSAKAGGTDIPTEMGDGVTDKVIAAWDSIKGKLMAAAIIRMVTRLVAGIATEKAVSEASGSAVGGLMAGLAVQGAMTAFDTPDTRSWVTLPHEVHFSRIELPPGKQKISVVFEGNGTRYVAEREIEVKAGGFTVVSVNTMR